MKVKKAIIPAAGLGTRFLPATKAMPKEMLPIVDKPIIQYIVEEAIESGIEDIIIVTGKGKRAIEDHFDSSFELECHLLKKGKKDLLDTVQKTSKMIDIHYIRQKEPKGLGHAIWCARSFIGDEPFAVLLGDIIVESQHEPCLKQLIDIHNVYHSPIIGVESVPLSKVSNYGIVETKVKITDRFYEISKMIEKPSSEETTSNLAIMGRYILTPEIFSILENLNPGVGGEIQLTDAVSKLNKRSKVFAYEINGKTYDVGDKLGLIRAAIEYGLKRNEFKDELRSYLTDLYKEL